MMGKILKRCKWCKSRLTVTYKCISVSDFNNLTSYLKKHLSPADRLCEVCFLNANDTPRKLLAEIGQGKNTHPVKESGSEDVPSKKIKLDIPKARSRNHVCFVCCKEIKKKSKKSLILSLEQKYFQELASLYLRSQGHVQSILMEVFCFYSRIKQISSVCFVEGKEIKELLSAMRTLTEMSSKLDFDDTVSLSDRDYLKLTGLNKARFNEVHSCMTSIRSTHVIITRTALALLLVKLRTGLSLPVLSLLFGINKCTCSKSVHAASPALMTDFVHIYLGFGHISRDEIITAIYNFCKTYFWRG